MAAWHRSLKTNTIFQSPDGALASRRDCSLSLALVLLLSITFPSHSHALSLFLFHLSRLSSYTNLLSLQIRHGYLRIWLWRVNCSDPPHEPTRVRAQPLPPSARSQPGMFIACHFCASSLAISSFCQAFRRTVNPELHGRIIIIFLLFGVILQDGVYLRFRSDALNCEFAPFLYQNCVVD